MAHEYEVESFTKKFAVQAFTKSVRIVTKDEKGKYTKAGKVFWLKQRMDLEAIINLVDMLDDAFAMGKSARSKEFAKLLNQE